MAKGTEFIFSLFQCQGGTFWHTTVRAMHSLVSFFVSHSSLQTGINVVAGSFSKQKSSVLFIEAT